MKVKVTSKKGQVAARRRQVIRRVRIPVTIEASSSSINAGTYTEASSANAESTTINAETSSMNMESSSANIEAPAIELTSNDREQIINDDSSHSSSAPTVDVGSSPSATADAQTNTENAGVDQPIQASNSTASATAPTRANMESISREDLSSANYIPAILITSSDGSPAMRRTNIAPPAYQQTTGQNQYPYGIYNYDQSNLWPSIDLSFIRSTMMSIMSGYNGYYMLGFGMAIDRSAIQLFVDNMAPILYRIYGIAQGLASMNGYHYITIEQMQQALAMFQNALNQVIRDRNQNINFPM